MTWRNFQYAFLHAARDAGASAITDNSHGWLTANPKDFLIDDRAGSLATFDSSESDHWIQVNRGSAGLEAIDRLIVPAGHNFAGADVRVRSSSVSDFSSDISTHLNTAAAAGLFDPTWSISTTKQYLRMDWPSDSGAWAIPQLIYTRTRTTTRGPEQGWGDMLLHNTLDFQKESGSIASLSLGADRRLFELVYRDVVLAADLLVFSDLLETCGTSKPFYLDPAFDTEAAIWVKLTQDSRQVQDPAIPAATDSTQRRIELSMLEHLA